MTRRLLLGALAAVLLAGLGALIVRKTAWEQISVPLPLAGEARINPFYGAQRLAEALGARPTWTRSGLDLPPPGGVLVLSGWHWDLSRDRRDRVKQWVEAGGRLVVDRLLVSGGSDFEDWSGVSREHQDAAPEASAECDGYAEHAPAGERASFKLCGFPIGSRLHAHGEEPEWALVGNTGTQVIRVPVRAGTVTVINATPFRYREILDGDHGRLFVAATQLAAGDEVHFVSEDAEASLLALLWRWGAPFVVLAAALVAAIIWRGAVRLGPVVPSPALARRSLAEQIRGAAGFAQRYGNGAPLHTAAVRALTEAGRQRIPGFAQLSIERQVEAVARVAGRDRATLANAVSPATPNGQPLHVRLAELETARREILNRGRGPTDATE